MSASAQPINEAKLHEFMMKAVGEMGAAMNAALILVGDKLGIYKAMAGAGPMTSEEIAAKTKTHERYVREWLAAQSAGGFITACLAAWLLVPWLGENFFPVSDNGQLILHLRAKTGTRIEETARLADLVEAAIRREIPAAELDNIIDNIGLPYSTINYMYSRSGFIGTADADILVTLKEGHRPTADHVRNLRRRLPERWPSALSAAAEFISRRRRTGA